MLAALHVFVQLANLGCRTPSVYGEPHEDANLCPYTYERLSDCMPVISNSSEMI